MPLGVIPIHELSGTRMAILVRVDENGDICVYYSDYVPSSNWCTNSYSPNYE